jgi:hypothetical protein
MLFCACDLDTNVDSLQYAIDYNNMLYDAMQPVNSKYNITERNLEEIALQNFSLGTIKVYDKYGVRFSRLAVENKTVFHNWYSIKADENGIIEVNIFNFNRTDSFAWMNEICHTVHDRALTINFQPYNDLLFASVEGEVAYKNTQYFTAHSDEILFPVIINVTQFEMTKIISRGNIFWNSNQTSRFRTYVISLIKIVFEDTTYTNGTILEYNFSITVSSVYDFDSVFEYGEVL